MKLRTYSLKVVRALEEESEGLLLDLSDVPENYEVVLRPMKTIGKHPKEQILYSNEKEH